MLNRHHRNFIKGETELLTITMGLFYLLSTLHFTLYCNFIAAINLLQLK